MGVRMYTQVYVQLCIQLNLRDETRTISTTPPSPFYPSRSRALPPPFKGRLNTIKRLPPLPYSLARMGALRPSLPYPAAVLVECTTEAPNA